MVAGRETRSVGHDTPSVGGGPAAVASRRPPWPAAVLMVVLAIGFLVAVASPALRSPPDASFVDGTWTSELEERLLEGTVLRSLATTTWGAIDLTVFGQGSPGVLIGQEGWLFSSEEFGRDEVAERFTTSAPVAEIAGVAERLREDGVDLLVVLVPAKARVHDEALGRYVLPPAADARYRVLATQLREAGVATVDGAEAMASLAAAERRFLRTDTHWTPAAARAVAVKAAREVAEAQAGAAWLGSTRYEVASAGEAEVEGDLLAFVPLGPLHDLLGPPADTIPRSRAEPTGGDEGGILEDVRLPVTLVGTSYSADPRWGFADSLRVALGSDLLVAATEGDGPFAPMRAYLDGEAYENARPEVVIWEIPERYAWPEVGW